MAGVLRQYLLLESPFTGYLLLRKMRDYRAQSQGNQKR
jgi:hypothetical protein